MISTESEKPSTKSESAGAGPKEAVRFGTDGWRGVIGRDYTFENVRLVSHATARTFEKPSLIPPKVPVGFDNRFLAEQFAEEAARVLSLYRFKPMLLSESVTSPLLSFITWKMKAPFGVMITASHNPAEYLGYKVKGSFGGSIAAETAQEIEKNLAGVTLEAAGKIGPPAQAAPLKPHLEDYFQYLSGHIDFGLFKKASLPVSFDVLFGPGGKIAETLLKRKSRLKVSFLHNVRDPLFGGLHPEPIEEYLGELKEQVKKAGTALGLALDGDADRLGVVDERGRYLTPQQVYALLLYYLVSEKKLKGRVVQAVSLGYLSERIAKDFGLPFTEVSVGFKHVAKEILKGDVLIGGEESGGYAFGRISERSGDKPLLPERDGLLSALLLIEMVLRTGKNLSALLGQIEKRYGASCYLRHDAPLARPIADKSEFITRLWKRIGDRWLKYPVREIRTRDGLKVVLDDGSWVLVRPSGTEPLLRIYSEFPKHSLSRKSLQEMSRLACDLV